MKSKTEFSLGMIISERENACWAALKQRIKKGDGAIDQEYTDQKAIALKIADLCQKFGLPQATPVVQLIIYLEWRSHFLTQLSKVWVCGELVALSMQKIEFDGRILKKEAFENGYFSHLSREKVLSYPRCAASVGDVISLEAVLASSRKYAFPVSTDVLNELEGDRRLPNGSIDYASWSAMFRRDLDRMTLDFSKIVCQCAPIQEQGGNDQKAEIDMFVLKIAALLLEGAT